MSPIDSTEKAAVRAAAPAGQHRSSPLNVHDRRLLLASVDAAGSLLGLSAAALILRQASLPWFWAVTAVLSWVIALVMVNGYALRIPSSRQLSVIAVVKAAPLVLAVAAILYLVNTPSSRKVLLVAIVLEALVVGAARLTVARILLHHSLASRAVLLGEEFDADVTDSLNTARFERQIVARLDSGQLQDRSSSAVEELQRLFDEETVDEVILSPRELRQAPEVVETCVSAGVRVVPSSRLSEEYLGRVSIADVDASWYLGLPVEDLWERPYSMVRRLMDILFSLLISAPFLVLLPLLTILIKLDSPGPVFLIQRRVGLLGHQFDLLKLRTMRTDAEAGGAQLAVKSDARLTHLGRFLRRTRIDEIPQALNILRGDMSFIGPRPERPELSDIFEVAIPQFRARLMVKPGLTGWAQVRSGYASSVDETRRKLEYDLYYIKHRSLRLDLQILAGTFVAVAGLRGL